MPRNRDFFDSEIRAPHWWTPDLTPTFALRAAAITRTWFGIGQGSTAPAAPGGIGGRRDTCYGGGSSRRMEVPQRSRSTVWSRSPIITSGLVRQYRELETSSTKLIPELCDGGPQTTRG
ncbi:hypothetical protein TrVFT333_003695 [Trichoderma virens FT-333]|nr:hypothetical protein TrVFT333_003695 [Trichoderma virens FT-333]